MHNVKAFAPLVIHLDIVLGAINDWESDTHTLTFTTKLHHTLQIFVREKNGNAELYLCGTYLAAKLTNLSIPEIHSSHKLASFMDSVVVVGENHNAVSTNLHNVSMGMSHSMNKRITQMKMMTGRNRLTLKTVDTTSFQKKRCFYVRNGARCVF